MASRLLHRPHIRQNLLQRHRFLRIHIFDDMDDIDIPVRLAHLLRNRSGRQTSIRRKKRSILLNIVDGFLGGVMMDEVIRESCDFWLNYNLDLKYDFLLYFFCNCPQLCFQCQHHLNLSSQFALLVTKSSF